MRQRQREITRARAVLFGPEGAKAKRAKMACPGPVMLSSFFILFSILFSNPNSNQVWDSHSKFEFTF
jgi:hypothetical protein